MSPKSKELPVGTAGISKTGFQAGIPESPRSLWRQNSLRVVTPGETKPVSKCKICSHEKRDEIEQDFIAWKSPIAIAEEYGLADRMNVYRHANALGLFEKRRRNIRAALERIIERARRR